MQSDADSQFIQFAVVLNLVKCIEYFSFFLVGDADTVICDGNYYFGIIFRRSDANRTSGIFQGVA